MIRTLVSSAFFLFGLFTIIACSDSTELDQTLITQPVGHPDETKLSDSFSGHIPSSDISTPNLNGDTTIFYRFNEQPIEVIIRFPTQTEFKGTILALPGWNFSNSQWCDSTQLCVKALNEGYAVILPEMGKSIYCDSIFPETRKDWLKYPTRSWIKETMIPAIQSDFQLLMTDQSNYVIGLSTGARGAVLLALDLPETFNACAALSGDFDQTRYTKDNLYNGYYGSYLEFTDRWVGKDNAVTSIDQLTVPVYLAHGEKDKIVPIAYSQQLFVELQESGNEGSILNVNPNAGHTYTFWNSEVDAVLEYFEKYRVY